MLYHFSLYSRRLSQTTVKQIDQAHQAYNAILAPTPSSYGLIHISHRGLPSWERGRPARIAIKNHSSIIEYNRDVYVFILFIGKDSDEYQDPLDKYLAGTI